MQVVKSRKKAQLQREKQNNLQTQQPQQQTKDLLESAEIQKMAMTKFSQKDSIYATTTTH